MKLPDTAKLNRGEGGEIRIESEHRIRYKLIFNEIKGLASLPLWLLLGGIKMESEVFSLGNESRKAKSQLFVK